MQLLILYICSYLIYIWFLFCITRFFGLRRRNVLKKKHRPPYPIGLPVSCSSLFSLFEKAEEEEEEEEGNNEFRKTKRGRGKRERGEHHCLSPPAPKDEEEKSGN